MIKKPHIPKSKSIFLPQVKSVHLDFDYKFIHECLRPKKKAFIRKLNWPEAIRSLLKKTRREKIKLEHIRSCCDKAIEEQIKPFERELEKALWRDAEFDRYGNVKLDKD